MEELYFIYMLSTPLPLHNFSAFLRNTTQSFTPDEDSSSFQMPKSEMNVASGCPQFCSLAVLENPSYACADTIYLKGATNLRGIEHIS